MDNQQFNTAELEQLRLRQIKTNKSKILIREIIINLIFLYVLFVACYANCGDKSFSYNTQIYETFKEFKNVSNFIFEENVFISILLIIKLLEI